jgi:uncharacterized membrane protein YkvA (DUF1232 family)
VETTATAVLSAVVLWVALVVALLLAGRRTHAVAVARFIPDAVVLFKRLLADQRVARRHKLLLLATIGYLALPIDLVPDFLPIAGQLDDVLLVTLALRLILRSSSRMLLEELWPGPPESLRALQRFV